jgi:peptidoglycan/LPS O-acetylase OafA/YrhL
MGPSELRATAAIHPPVAPLNALTTLRFLAAFHVVLFHMLVLHIFDGGPWWYRNFASLGYVAVECFFVLSGFILVYVYNDTVDDARRFWQARFARIYPAYFLSLLATAPVFFYALRHVDVAYYAWSKHHFVPAVILTLGMLQAWFPHAALTWNPVCWSLSCEAFFYLLFPLALRWSRPLARGALYAGVAVCSIVSLSVALSYIVVHPDGIEQMNSPQLDLPWRNILFYNPVLRLPEFLTGVFVGRLFLTRGEGNRQALLLVVGGLAVLGVMTVLFGTIPLPMIVAGFLPPAFAAIIYGLALRPRWVAPLESRWLVFLGEASYSLYLLHSLVLIQVFSLTASLPLPLRQVLAPVASVVVAILAYLVVERPCRELLRPKGRKPVRVGIGSNSIGVG